MPPDSREDGLSGRIVISVDAMGGDRGPAAVIGGLTEAATRIPDVDFILHGPEEELTRLLAKRADIAARCTIRHASGVVTMEDKPGQVMRHGGDKSIVRAAHVAAGARDSVLRDSHVSTSGVRGHYSPDFPGVSSLAPQGEPGANPNFE